MSNPEEIEITHNEEPNPDDFVVIPENDIFWRVQVVSKTDPHYGPYVELQWGWTAGKTPEDLADYAEDAPQGYDRVKVHSQDVAHLRDQLNAWLEKHPC